MNRSNADATIKNTVVIESRPIDSLNFIDMEELDPNKQEEFDQL
jgi:hypothetical protein